MKQKQILIILAFLSIILAWSLPFVPTAKATTTTYDINYSKSGWLGRQNSFYPPTTTTVWVASGESYLYTGQYFTSPNYIQYRTFLDFDTSAIPDTDIIQSATLRIYLLFDYSVSAEFLVKIYSGSYGSSLDTGDWALVTTYEGVWLNTADGKPTGAWYDISVSLSSINKTGDSQYRMTSSRDEASNTPTGAEWITTGGGNLPSISPHLIVEYTAASAPTNDSLNLTNPSIDTKGCLAMKQDYIFRAKVSDPFGGSNLNYTELTLLGIGSPVKYKWVRSTDTFSEVSGTDPSDYTEITSTGVDSSLSGSQWTLDFKLKFHWNFPDQNQHTMRLYSINNYGYSDQDDYSNIYYVIQVLTTSSLSVSDYRVNPSQAGVTFSGYWYYQTTSIYPPDGDYQVKIKLSGVQKGSTDTTLVSGAFSINDVTAESSVAAYSYTVEASHMAGAGSFSSVIVDKIAVTITPDMTQAGIGQTVHFTVSGKSSYDSTSFTFATLQITRNGTNYTTNTTFTDMRSSMSKWIYTTTTATDSTYGLNQFTTNTVTVEWLYKYILYGAYNEQGFRSGAINVTYYSQSQSPDTFLLDGTHSVGEDEIGVNFKFSLGYNQSRTYYLTSGYETIYVFKPTEPYYFYYFTVIDYVGIHNAYLESRLSLNGTYFVVERWKLSVFNEIPFTFSWATTYNMRLICDEGTYIYGDYVAGATNNFVLPVTMAQFPPSSISIEGIQLSASRLNGTNIQILYSDSLLHTNWMQVQIYHQNGLLAYSTNNTGNTQNIIWNLANPSASYTSTITVSSSQFGTKTWSFGLQYLGAPPTNPWDLSFLGTFPIPATQIVNLVMVCLVFAVFSEEYSWLVGIIATVVASILVAIGWSTIPPSWLAVTMGISIIIAISIKRRRAEGAG
jgi:hypothetical protein